ncbi:MAG: D-aminoacylase, partial [Cetobacterium sp.]
MITLIKQVLIVDGNKTAPFVGDVLIEDDKILKIASKITENADKVIEAKGRVICPGFIDTH